MLTTGAGGIRWVVPCIWAPITVALSAHSLFRWQAALPTACGLIVAGLLLWQLLEYSLHRFVFHAQPTGYWGITLHFLFHGCHHKFPTDPLRLVFPPIPAGAIATCIWAALRAALSQVCEPGAASASDGGMVSGCIVLLSVISPVRV